MVKVSELSGVALTLPPESALLACTIAFCQHCQISFDKSSPGVLHKSCSCRGCFGALLGPRFPGSCQIKTRSVICRHSLFRQPVSTLSAGENEKKKVKPMAHG
ncbi:hypothetical protein BDV30DRAFT_201535 [Aspergillus minisclerotigenes]|uniref:Uncharacterized protein n=1 Tax=Aspergillus minisclerotigenes TaxID=656917 RepID=A0A5N6JKI0_9EURO|nr:hypothetical protein BDV30DRAFT_201535 [Aspergillus minisclerotigenes]